MAYQIVSLAQSQLTGETVYRILCDLSSDLPSGTISGSGYSGPIVQGCSAKIIENGAEYVANSSGEWVKQTSGNAWENVYTKDQMDTFLEEKANKASVVPLVNQAQKNLMKLSGSDVTGYGIRCTFDYEAGTITLDGINADKKCTGSFNIQAADSRALGLEAGTVYHFSCDGYQTSNDTIGLYVYTSSATPVTQFDSFTNNEQAWNPAWEQASGFRLFVRQGTVVDNVVLKPMICTKENYDLTSQFEPYTPTLHELYSMILQLQTAAGLRSVQNAQIVIEDR